MADDTLTRIVRYLADTSKAVSEIDKLTRATDKAGKEMDSVGNQLSKFGSSLKMIGGAAIVGFIGRELVGAFMNLAESLDAVDEAAQGVGISAQELSRLQYAADFAGIGAQKLTQGMAVLADKVATVETGTDKASQMMRAMGVTAKDTAATALNKLADAFARTEDGPNKTAAAIEIFGKKLGPAFIAFLNQGAAGIKEFTDEADRLGGSLTPELAKQASDFNDNLARLSRTFHAVGLAIARDLLPWLNKLSEAWLENMRAFGPWEGTMQSIAESFLGTEGEKLDAALRAQMARVAQVEGWVEEAKNTSRALDFIKKIDIANQEKHLAKEKAILADIVSKYNLYLDLRKQAAKTTPEPGKGPGVPPPIKDKTADNAKKTAEAFKLADEPLKKFLDNLERAGELNIDEKLAGIAERMEFLSTQGPGAADAINALAEAYKKLKAEKDPASAVRLEFENQQKAIAAANAFNVALTEMVLAEKISAAAAEEMWKTYGKGADKAKNQTDDLSKMITENLITATSNWVSGMIDGIGEAGASFKDFIEDALKGLAKLLLQMRIMQAAKSAGFFGSAEGSAFSASGVQFLAQGGILGGPTLFAAGGRLAVAGEAGPEAVVPLQRTSSGDLGVAASPVTINITNNAGTDTQVSADTSDNADGSRIVDILIERKVRSMMADGSLDRTMRSAYGLARQAG